MPLYKYLIPLLLSLTISTGSVLAQENNHQDSIIANLKKKILDLNLPGVTITNIQFVQKRSYTPKATRKELTDLPAFCLVAATLRPTIKSEIRIEIWMPQNNWSGRFLGTGNGGGGGGIPY